MSRSEPRVPCNALAGTGDGPHLALSGVEAAVAERSMRLVVAAVAVVIATLLAPSCGSDAPATQVASDDPSPGTMTSTSLDDGTVPSGATAPIVGQWRSKGSSEPIKFGCFQDGPLECSESFSWLRVDEFEVDEDLHASVTGPAGTCTAQVDVEGGTVALDDLRCDGRYTAESGSDAGLPISFDTDNCFTITEAEGVELYFGRVGVYCDGSPTTTSSTYESVEGAINPG